MDLKCIHKELFLGAGDTVLKVLRYRMNPKCHTMLFDSASQPWDCCGTLCYLDTQ